jgi:hypothetical protein
MAKITVAEHTALGIEANGYVAPILGKALVVQASPTAPSASSAQTAVPDNNTRILRLCSDVALHVGYGATATTDDPYYPAGAEIVRAIGKGGRLSYIAG